MRAGHSPSYAEAKKILTMAASGLAYGSALLIEYLDYVVFAVVV